MARMTKTSIGFGADDYVEDEVEEAAKSVEVREAKAEVEEVRADEARGKAEGELHRLLNESQAIGGRIEAMLTSPSFGEADVQKVEELERRQSVLPSLIRGAHIRVLKLQEAGLVAQRRVAQLGQERAQAEALTESEHRDLLVEALKQCTEKLMWLNVAASGEGVREVDRRLAEVRYQMQQLIKGNRPATDEEVERSRAATSRYLEGQYYQPDWELTLQREQNGGGKG